MADSGDGPDTTSIKPFSSLRSKFENLAKDNDTLQSPVGPARQSYLAAPSPGARPKSSGGDSDVVGISLGSSAGPQGQGAAIAPTPRKLRPDSLQPRPASMGPASPAATHAPPLVTVDGPRSPQKGLSLDLRPSATIGPPPLLPLTPDRTSDSPKSHSRNISRTATPALEARAAAFLQASESPIVREAPVLPSPKPKIAKPEPTKEPPVVNRAAKPKVPLKPQVLGTKPGNLATPEPNPELTDRSVSPFSTPPSSGHSSPDIKKDAAASSESARETVPHAPVPQRPRNDSEASWVQRIRGESDASVVERARAGSNASFVEASSLPDTWIPPPTHHSVAARREKHTNGLGRAPTMPARYRHVTRHDHSSTEDLPEERPRLPARPELQVRPGRTSPPKVRSGRTSPVKFGKLPAKRSVDGLKSAVIMTEPEATRIPAVKAGPKSALSQGFERVATQSAPLGPPAVPAPRRSTDQRRPPPPPPSSTAPASAAQSPSIAHGNGHWRGDEDAAVQSTFENESLTGPQDFPDGTQTNRRPPRFKQRPWQIATGYDTRLFAICGEYVCTSGYITKAWNLRTGEELLNMEHRDQLRVASVVFKPSPDIDDEGKRLWVGTNTGDIHEIDIPSQSIVKTKAAHNRREVIRMFRYGSELWTMDDGGELLVWKPDHKGMPSLDSRSHNWRIPKGVTFSLASGKQVWIACGKEIRVFLPGASSDVEFNVLKAPLVQSRCGDVTSGATLNGKHDLIYFGHSDGKVSIYNRANYTCHAVVNVSLYKISSLVGVGDYLWAGYSTGMTYVYDTSTTPWTVKKDWKAHDKHVCSIIADPSAMWKMGRLNVITLGLDNQLRIWDGMLEDDWVETRLQSRDSEFCKFRQLTAAVLTWNAGAAKPSYLQHSVEDSTFFREYMTSHEPPDIFVFGFQELVDLEDKKVTAKSFFKSKKKDPAEQEHMSRQYRAWRDHLSSCLDQHMSTDQSYTLVHTSSMVGLFTCVFAKSSEKQRIRYVHTAEVKRGMGGMHGNKGALIVRMILDDSSLCFINCHLAAGQTHTMHRNNDVAEILETNALPQYPLDQNEAVNHSDIFAGGGDGSMVLDHEICILNGDLNYRIDTMGRDAVVKQVKQGNLGKLLERDQLLLSRKKNPGFRLRAFQESPITFAPTYKYNVRSDDYDTSEKKRAPAWCDRILYRGLGKVKMEEYRRWDTIRVSDHRPVSGRLKLRIKTVDPDKREIVWDKCVQEFGEVKVRLARAAQLDYLTNTLGLSTKEATAALQKGSAK